jgi:hypothetical protein
MARLILSEDEIRQLSEINGISLQGALLERYRSSIWVE